MFYLSFEQYCPPNPYQHVVMSLKVVTSMEDRYFGRGVNLSLLVDRLMVFFKERNFTSGKKKIRDGYVVFAGAPRSHKMVGVTKVLVKGDPTDFIVRFDGGSRSDAYRLLGYLTYYFGGAILVSKSYESQEAMAKLERQFWVYVNETVDRLTELE